MRGNTSLSIAELRRSPKEGESELVPACGDGETVWSVESDGEAGDTVLSMAELRACNRI